MKVEREMSPDRLTCEISASVVKTYFVEAQVLAFLLYSIMFFRRDGSVLFRYGRMEDFRLPVSAVDSAPPYAEAESNSLSAVSNSDPTTSLRGVAADWSSSPSLFCVSGISVLTRAARDLSDSFDVMTTCVSLCSGSRGTPLSSISSGKLSRGNTAFGVTSLILRQEDVSDFVNRGNVTTLSFSISERFQKLQLFSRMFSDVFTSF